MPTLRQLRYLVAVADTLHFRRAAALCHVTQPTLSSQLQTLEQRLGAQLVERDRHGVMLTAVGRSVVERARTVLRDIEDIVAVAGAGSRFLEGPLRVGVLPTLGPYLMPHVLPRLRREYPHLQLLLREDKVARLIEQLEAGELDLLIFPLPVSDPGLAVLPLFEEPLSVAAPSDHRIEACRSVSGADLRDETVLVLEQGHRLHDQVMELCRDFGAQPNIGFAGTSLDTLRQMVAMGVGVTFLPELYVRSEAVNDPNVLVRPFDAPGPARSIGLVWRERAIRQREFTTIGALIKEELAAIESGLTITS